MVVKVRIIAPLVFWGISRITCALIVFLAAALPFASADDMLVPNYTDPRERIPAPDLTPYGRIRFVTTVDFPPFSFLDQTGHLAGFHVDLARAICDELDVLPRCQIQALPWGELEGALPRRWPANGWAYWAAPPMKPCCVTGFPICSR